MRSFLSNKQSQLRLKGEIQPFQPRILRDHECPAGAELIEGYTFNPSLEWPPLGQLPAGQGVQHSPGYGESPKMLSAIQGHAQRALLSSAP